MERISESANQRTRNTGYGIRNTHHAPRTTHHAPKLLFLTSPNNPDGSLLAPDDLRRLLDLPLIVVLDEAYIEFAGLERSAARWVTERENLIVLRTFKQWAGIAGLRLGYGVFPGWPMPALWKAKQPYNVNVAATVAGLASLAHRAEIQTHRGCADHRAREAVPGVGEVPVPAPLSQPGKLHSCRVVGRDARGLKEALAGRDSRAHHAGQGWRTASVSARAGRSRPMRCWRRWRKCSAGTKGAVEFDRSAILKVQIESICVVSEIGGI